jgi:hypothetical protein
MVPEVGTMVQGVSMDEGHWSKGQRFHGTGTNKSLEQGKRCRVQANPYSPQVILERAHKIDRKLMFEGDNSNVVMDSQVRKRLLSIHVSVKMFESHIYFFFLKYFESHI